MFIKFFMLAKFSTYQQLLIAVLSTVSGLILVFVVLNLTTKLQVHKVDILPDKSQADIVGQRITISFNRPIRLSNPEKVIEVNPPADLQAVTQGEDLVIIFTSTLNADQAYRLKISKDNLIDVYGSKIDNDVIVDWHTRKLNLAYLEKNTLPTKDRILTTQAPFTDSRELYTASDILRFRLRGEWLAVITRVSAELNELNLINVVTHETRKISNSHQNIYWAEFANDNDLYVVLQDTSKVDEYNQAVNGRQIFNYEIDNNSLQPLALGIEVGDVDELILSQDGQALVIKDTSNILYYLVDLSDTDNTASLGKFIGAGGFNHAAEKLIFTEMDVVSETKVNPFIVVLDAQRQHREITDGLIFTIDPIFFKRQDFIAYSRFWSPIENTRGLFEIIILDDAGNTYAQVRIPEASLEMPRVSPDDHYLAIESYSIPQLMDLSNIRVLGFQAKPSRGTLVIYDVLNKQILPTNLRGIEAQWY